MIGFFISLSGLLSAFSAPFASAGSAAGSLATARAERARMRAAEIAARPVVVEGPSSIPRVKKRTDAPADGA